MPDNAFLTDRRREFLEGEYDLSRSKDRHLKKSLNDSTKTALEELIEVAQSPHIDNHEVFEPAQVAQLVEAVLRPTQNDLEPVDEFVSVETIEKYTDNHLTHCDRLYVELDRLMHPYRDGRFPDLDD